MKKEYSAREKALDILMKYEKEGKKLGPLLLSVFGKDDETDKRDRDFIKALTEGTVERLISLDFIIDHVSKIKTDRMKPVIRMIIRTGTYQLVFMDNIPDRAAVNESVELAGKKHLEGLKPFVNGVLRAVQRYRDKGINWPDAATEYSCPGWIADTYIHEYGEDKAHEMMKAGIGGKPLYLRVNRCRTDRDSLMEVLKKEGISSVREVYDPGTKEKLPNTLVVKERQFSPADSESFAKGLYSIQDLSSQLAIYDLWKQVDVYINQTNMVDITLTDLCSAPGGKTCFAAEMLQVELKGKTGNDHHVRAFDISDRKLEKIRENLARTGIEKVELIVKDATAFDPSLENSADIIIADLPCSGLGVIGRKVDIKYRVRPKDINELCKLQREILDNAARYLKPSGILLFSVCTVTREETSGQAGYIENLGLHKVSERLLLQGIDPCDGFYYSIFKK